MSEITEMSPALLSSGINTDNLKHMIEAYTLLLDCYQLLGKDNSLRDEEAQAAMNWLALVWDRLGNMSRIPMRAMVVQEYINKMEQLHVWMYPQMETMMMPIVGSGGTVPIEQDLIRAAIAAAPTEPQFQDPPGFLHLPPKKRKEQKP